MRGDNLVGLTKPLSPLVAKACDHYWSSWIKDSIAYLGSFGAICAISGYIHSRAGLMSNIIWSMKGEQH